MSFLGKTVFVTGAFRGIGRATCNEFVKNNANVVFFGRKFKDQDNEQVVDEITQDVEKFGGKSLVLFGDVRYDLDIQNALDATINKFGNVDILVNNAGVISMKSISQTSIEDFDMNIQTNLRPAFFLPKLFFPYLCKSENPHIINICPPFNMKNKYFKEQLAYTVSKFGTSMCVKGMAEEFRSNKIAVNGIWPKNVTYTNAIEKLYGKKIKAKCETPAYIANAIVQICLKDSKVFTGNLLIDDDVLNESSVTDSFNTDTAAKFIPCLYVENNEKPNKDIFTHPLLSKFIDTFTKINIKILEGKFDNVKLNLEMCVTFDSFDLYWFIDLLSSDKGCFQGKGKAVQSKVKLSADLLNQLIDKKADPYTAFLFGDLKFSGNTNNGPMLMKLYKDLFG